MHTAAARVQGQLKHRKHTTGLSSAGGSLEQVKCNVYNILLSVWIKNYKINKCEKNYSHTSVAVRIWSDRFISLKETANISLHLPHITQWFS